MSRRTTSTKILRVLLTDRLVVIGIDKKYRSEKTLTARRFPLSALVCAKQP